jgi:hypothetical protein
VARDAFHHGSAAAAARRRGAAQASSEAMEARPLAPRWEALLALRLPLYLRAHHRVEVNALAPEAVARRVLGLVGGAGAWSAIQQAAEAARQKTAP